MQWLAYRERKVTANKRAEQEAPVEQRQRTRSGAVKDRLSFNHAIVAENPRDLQPSIERPCEKVIREVLHRVSVKGRPPDG